MPVEINLSPTFQKSLSRLTAQEQALVKQSVMDFMLSPEASGHRLHALNMRERRFQSISPNMDLRIIVLVDGARHVMMYVDHHDAAYRWAERRKLETHPVTGSAQIVEFEEVVREEVRYVTRERPKPPLFLSEADDYLLGLGVPAVYLAYVKEVDEDGLMELMPRLPEEAQEALLALASGERPEVVVPPSHGLPLVLDPFNTPDARRRFWVAADEEALAQALERPWDQWLVFLHPTQRDAVERNFNGPARVSGSAGTGKTVVAMHRAALLARLSHGGRLLLTTFSSTLAARLADGMDHLLGPDSGARGRVQVSHLHEYARHLVADRNRQNIAVVQEGQLKTLLSSSRGDLSAEFSDGFLKAEWDAVVDYWGIKSWDEYRNISRVGRGGALSPRKRQMLWEIFGRVQEKLTASSLMTWGDVCDAAREIVLAEQARPFRHVVVDEAQDLGPRELKLVAVLAAPGPRSLFFAGDTGQRIYRYPFSWVAVGIDVRGRAQRLRINYRTSEQIKRFSDSLLPSEMEEVDGAAEGRKTISLLSGPEPEIKGTVNPGEEIAALAAWLRGLVERGVKPEQIGIFARIRALLTERAEPALRQAGLRGAMLSGDGPMPEDCVSLGTMHAAKGLEFRAVALVGCSAVTLPLAAALDAADSDDARAIAMERERHLLYVGCTRAREALLITYAGNPSPFLPNPDSP